MDKKTLTIFTPTYNRAYILGQLYESLLRQKCKNFQWIIVDDGSKDNTELKVEEWIKEDFIPIKYYKQANGGKQRAHNRGVEECDTELFMCVDSDDYIVDDAIDLILEKWETVKNKEEVAGIVGLRGKNKSEPLGTYMPDDVYYSKLDDLYQKYNFKGDTSLIFRTDILKKYPYWVAEGEKFIGEGYVYQQIDQKYTLAVFGAILIVCKYLEDGYTKNVRRLTKENPISYTELKRMTICCTHTWKERYFHTILCLVGCILSGEKNFLRIVPNKILGILAYIPARIVWMLFYKNA